MPTYMEKTKHPQQTHHLVITPPKFPTHFFPTHHSPHSPYYLFQPNQKKGGYSNFQQPAPKTGSSGLAKKGREFFGLGLDTLGLTGGVDHVDSSMGACLVHETPQRQTPNADDGGNLYIYMCFLTFFFDMPCFWKFWREGRFWEFFLDKYNLYITLTVYGMLR